MSNTEKCVSMKHYDVVISNKAREDMDAIHRYIAETLHEPVIAAKLYDRIADAILTLEEMPERIRIQNDNLTRYTSFKYRTRSVKMK